MKHSMPIHLKSCAQKFEQQQALKRPKERRKLPPPPPQFEMVRLASTQLMNGGKSGAKTSQKAMDDYNDAAFKQWDQEMLVPCKNCGRTFLPEKLAPHSKLCTPSNPFKPLPKAQNGKLGASMGVAGGARGSRLGGKKNSFNKMPPMEEVTSYDIVGRVQCRYCGRKFNEDRIEKHENACQVASKKRPVFNVKKQRVEEEAKYLARQNRGGRGAAQPQNNWRSKHQEFMQGIQAARKIKAIQESGGDIRSIPVVPSANPDYVQCPYCGRRYNPTVAERHIPKCKNIINKPKPPPSMRGGGYQPPAPQRAQPPAPPRMQAPAASRMQAPAASRMQATSGSRLQASSGSRIQASASQRGYPGPKARGTPQPKGYDNNDYDQQQRGAPPSQKRILSPSSSGFKGPTIAKHDAKNGLRGSGTVTSYGGGAGPQRYAAGGTATVSAARTSLIKQAAPQKKGGASQQLKATPCKACGGIIQAGNSMCFGCGAWNF